MVKENELEEMLELMGRISELEVKRAKVMRDSLKDKDITKLLDSMKEIVDEMATLKKEMDKFIDHSDFSPSDGPNLKITKTDFEQIFSKN